MRDAWSLRATAQLATVMHTDVCEHLSPMIEQSTGGSETWSATRSIVRPAI